MDLVAKFKGVDRSPVGPGKDLASNSKLNWKWFVYLFTSSWIDSMLCLNVEKGKSQRRGGRALDSAKRLCVFSKSWEQLWPGEGTWRDEDKVEIHCWGRGRSILWWVPWDGNQKDSNQDESQISNLSNWAGNDISWNKKQGKKEVRGEKQAFRFVQLKLGPLLKVWIVILLLKGQKICGPGSRDKGGWSSHI